MYINYVKNSVGTREENIAQFYFWGQQSSSVRFLSDLVAVSLTQNAVEIQEPRGRSVKLKNVWYVWTPMDSKCDNHITFVYFEQISFVGLFNNNSVNA